MMRFSPGLGAIRGWLPLAALMAACAAAPAAAQDLSRGRALYENRCTACHETSVHQRASRKAQSFAALRAEVERWNATTGGDWKRDEVDQVSAYLNERYYRFDCPPAVCKAAGSTVTPRAEAGAARDPAGGR